MRGEKLIKSKQGLRAATIFLLFSVGPSLVVYLSPIASNAPGLLLASIFALCTIPWNRRFLSSAAVGMLFALLGFSATHFSMAALLMPVDTSRFAGSLVLLAIMLSVATASAPTLFDGATIFTIRLIYVGFLVCTLLFMLGLEPHTVNASSKAVFPFTEPSFFALSFGPVLLFVCVTCSGFRRLSYLGLALIAALVMQNMTSLIAVLLVFFVCYPLRWGGIALALTLLAVGIFNVDLSYYTDRLDFSGDNENFTVLVYVQGWQMLFESWKHSLGWGIGFQQMGINGTSVDASVLINAMSGGDSNIFDGSFVLAKIVSEFGAFGVVAILIYLRKAMASFKRLRRLARSGAEAASGRIFSDTIVLMYLIEVFMRGAGYLTGTAALLVAALAYQHRQNVSRATLHGDILDKPKARGVNFSTKEVLRE
jgi:hypothetical protein